MEVNVFNVHHHLPRLQFFHRLLPAAGPVLLIATGYIDPGKWVANVEGGAHFELDLAVPMFSFSIAAILCQYMAARIGFVTGKDLAQICSEEYDQHTCMFLGIQMMISAAILDLTTIIGIGYSFNLLTGMSLSTCIVLTALDAAVFLLFPTLVERFKARLLLCTCVAGFVLTFCLLQVLASQSGGASFPVIRIMSQLSNENVFVLMSLLGATIVPHNFYLHSFLVRKCHGGAEAPIVYQDVSCNDHLFAVACVFGGIYLINFGLMSSAANTFFNSDLVLLTFPDAASLLEQAFRNRAAPFILPVVFCLTNQVVAVTWDLSAKEILSNLLGLRTPNWLRHAVGRAASVLLVLSCLRAAGAEGVHQLLLFSQVAVALLLPCSVAPLFRIASSRSIMGSHKMPPVLELVALIIFTGILGLNVFFMAEMMLGDSDWVNNLRWNLGGTHFSVPYVVLSSTASLSFFFTLRVAVTPLKSATQLDSQPWSSKLHSSVAQPSPRKPEAHGSENLRDDEPVPVVLPETILESDQEFYPESAVAAADASAAAAAAADDDDDESEKMGRDDKMVDSGRSRQVEQSGSDPGSLVKLGGLGRSARRQVAVILDEFWGQLYDFHGKETCGYVPALTVSHNVADNFPNASSLRSNDAHLRDIWSSQPATVHGYRISSVANQSGMAEPRLLAFPTRNVFPLQKELCSADPGVEANTKKYRSLPDMSEISSPLRDGYAGKLGRLRQDGPSGIGSSVGKLNYYERTSCSNSNGRGRGHLTFDDLSRGYGDALTSRPGSGNASSLWSKQPFEQFGVADRSRAAVGSSTAPVGSSHRLLLSLRWCIRELLRLERSDWLFRPIDGADEDLINRVASREKCLCERETRVAALVPSDSSPRPEGSAFSNNPPVSSVPHCGEGCVWKPDLIVSFGVWCILQILHLSLVESRPDLWGKYTYVLNRLQGIMEAAFSNPRSQMCACFCIEISKRAGSRHTTGAELLNLIRDVEIAISSRKGRCGTAAGDVAFAKGKENLTSVLKRYRRRLSNRPADQ